jgi:diguanylate cyclase (GGDEF)-like protein/PAS domain S-box-containing protein
MIAGSRRFHDGFKLCTSNFAAIGILRFMIGGGMSTISSPISCTECQALFGGLPDPVIACGTDGTIEFLNPAAERLTGRIAAEAISRPLAEVLPLRKEGSATPVPSPISDCVLREKSVGPFTATLSGSRETADRTVEVSAAPIREPGEPVRGVLVIVRDVTRERELARQMSYRATHDPLTRLVNRDEFERRLARALESARSRAHHALGFLDLDGFKRVNDSCGHLAGDSLLRQLGAMLRRRIRGRDTVARLGGDEFGILLEHCTPECAADIAEQLRREIADHRFACDSQSLQVGASIGIVSLGDGYAAPADVLRAADMACYEAKRSGGNQVSVGTANNSAMLHAPRLPA